MPTDTARWLVLLVCLAGCRDYAALGHGQGPVDLGSDAAAAVDLALDFGTAIDGAAPNDGMADLAFPGGPACDTIDLGGGQPTSGTFSGTHTPIAAIISSMISLSQLRAGPFTAGGRGVLAFDPSNGSAVLYDVPSPTMAASVSPASLTSGNAVATSVITADLDGDGVMEIVAAYASQVIVYRVTKGVLLATSMITPSSTPVALVAGNFDGNAAGDLLVFESTGIAEELLDVLSSAAPGSRAIGKFGTLTASTVADVNGDCVEDVVLVANGVSYVLHGAAPTGLGLPESYPLLTNVEQLGRARLDSPSGDALYSMLAGTIQVIVDGAVITIDSPSSGLLVALSTGDLNHDGLTDFIVWDDAGTGYGFRAARTGPTTYSFTQVAIPTTISRTATALILPMDFDPYIDLAVGAGMAGATPYYLAGK